MTITAVIDHSIYRLNFDQGKKSEIHHKSWREHLKISERAKFGRKIIVKWGHIALRSLQILYNFVSSAEK